MNEVIKNELIEILRRVIKLARNHQLITFEILKVISNSEMQEHLHKLAMKKIHLYQLQTENESDNAIIFLSLSIIAYENYDGDFWGHVHDVYNDLYSIQKSKDQVLDSKIRDIIGNMVPNDFSQTRKISYILWQSIVPSKYLDDFYNILLIVYINDLRRSLPDDSIVLEGLLKTIFKQISVKTDHENDILKSTIMNQAYKFIQSTRDIIDNTKYQSTIVRFSRYIIQSISVILKEENNYDKIPDFFITWSKKWYEDHGQRKIDYFENNKKDRNKDKISWKLDFLFEELNLILKTKTLFLPPDIDLKSIWIEVLSNDVSVYSNKQPRIIENDLSIELASLNIKVDFNPFDIKVIVHGLDLNHECINTEFLMFDSSGNRIIKTTKSSDYLYVLSKNINNSNLVSAGKTKHYDIGILNLADSENLLLNNQTYIIRNYQNSEILGEIINQSNMLINRKNYNIYEKGVYLVHPKIKSIKGILVGINGLFEELIYNDVDIEYSFNFTNLRHGLNQIEIKDISNEKILDKKWEILYLPELEINFLNESKKFSLVYKNKIIFDFFCNFIDSDKIVVDFSEENFKGVLSYNPLVPMISINSSKFVELSDYLWHDDYNTYDEIIVKGIDADSLKYYDSNNNYLEKIFEVQNSQEIGMHFKFNIAYLKTTLIDKNISMNFSKNSELVFSIKFLNRNEILEKDISLKIDSIDSVIFEIKKIQGKSKMDLLIYNNDLLFRKIEDIKVGSREIKSLQSKKRYRFKIVTGDIELFTKDLYYIKRHEFVGKIFKVEEVSLMVTSKISKTEWISKVDYDYVNNIYVIIRKLDEKINKFSGNLLIKKYNGNLINFNKINLISIDFYRGINDLTKISAYINTYYDEELLYYDVESQKIIDDNNEPAIKTIATIEEFILKLEEN